jgi:ABC-type Fe3+-hydroxamate transport system substrate-binding protein
MIVDALGRSFEFSDAPKRVVSLVPSLTETLVDIGAGPSIVGLTNYCIFPPGLRERVTTVGGTKNPKIELIRELRPDVVYMNLEENLRRHAEAIEEFAPVVTSEPKSVGDVGSLILQLGMIQQREEAAATLVRILEEQIRLARGAKRDFAFAVPIWKNPWMWCGGDTYVSHLVETIGGRNVLAELSRYPAMGLDDVLERKPDILFLPDEPYLFTAADAEELASTFSGRIIGPFEGHLFTWHGSRTIHGLRFLLKQPLVD